MHFSLLCIDFSDIFKCSADTKVLMAGRKRKDIPCIELLQPLDRKVFRYILPLLVFCTHLPKFIKIHVLIIVICSVKNFYNNYAVNKIKSV